ncbi:MAG: type II toxin-antitoxin system RelE/ParE family toxin [Aquabacterium sp.]
MSRLIWSPQALRDVQRLYRFLAVHNLDAAKRAVKAIRQEVKVLEHQPAIGRPMQDMEPEYREWLIDFGDSGYVALYRLAGDDVAILAVRHQREVGY